MAKDNIDGYTKELLEKLANMTFPGLAVLSRDCSLTKEQEEKYKVGTIIREPAFTEATYKNKGMVTTHRFTILSNHMVDFEGFEHGTNWGMVVAQRGSHFKVLDVYTYEGKTQILLLHLPDNKFWKKFEHVEFNLEKEFIEKCRASFEQKIHAPIAPSLATQEWLDRCANPLGMDENGELYDPDPDPETLFRHVSYDNSQFREFYNHYVIFRYPSMAEKLTKAYTDDGNRYENLLTFGYINREKKLTFHVLGVCCSTKDRGLVVSSMPDGAEINLDIETVFSNELLYLSEEQTDINLPFSREKQVQRFDYATPELNKVRNAEVLDPLRDPVYPDRVKILFVKEDTPAEEAVLDTMAMNDEGVGGELLTEQHLIDDVNVGDKIFVHLYRHEDDGTAVLIY